MSLLLFSSSFCKVASSESERERKQASHRTLNNHQYLFSSLPAPSFPPKLFLSSTPRFSIYTQTIQYNTNQPNPLKQPHSREDERKKKSQLIFGHLHRSRKSELTFFLFLKINFSVSVSGAGIQFREPNRKKNPNRVQPFFCSPLSLSLRTFRWGRREWGSRRTFCFFGYYYYYFFRAAKEKMSPRKRMSIWQCCSHLYR